MLRLAAIAITTCLTVGCAPKVKIEHPAQPALQIDATSVAVVSHDRECRDIADELATHLNENGLRVDPRAAVRLDLYGCGQSFETKVEVSQRADQQGVSSDERRATVEGRGHAAVNVTVHGETEATLIGSGSQLATGSWQNRDIREVLDMRRGVDKHITQAVARDLAEQISPMPTLVSRRVYSMAIGNGGRLHNQAVQAELSGDIPRAHTLALAALASRPGHRGHQRYVSDLDHLLQRLSRDSPTR
jgi:hypothetical protein